MKKITPGILLCFLLGLAASAVQGSVAGLDVTVSDEAGRLTYRGKTNADGTFATGPVKPGKYVVQFNARDARAGADDYAIVIAAGKQKVVAQSVAGEKLSGGGVAMRLNAGRDTRISGQIVTGGVDALGTRIVNGKRYVFVAATTGSHLGPRWVEEGTPASYNVTQVSIDSIRELQDRGSAQNR